MAQYTNKFKLGYFENGDKSDAIIESRRWRTIDSQMYGLFDVLGNGVIDGWDFVVPDEDQLLLSITQGSGHIGYVSVESASTQSIALGAGIRNYIYAVSSNTSYFNRDVSFTALPSTTSSDGYLLLGYVDTDDEGTSPIIKEVNIDDRVYISFKQQILNLIKEHRHIGGTQNPTKINLGTDVQGYLREDNIDDLDASFIATGVLSEDRIPQLDHLTKLSHVGILTHAQLDTFVQILSHDGARLMGETSSVDLLKLVLAIKHIYPEIDDYFVNEVAFIPGISPDTWVDKDNTTAEVDYRTSAEGGTHTITGTPAASTSTFTKKWDSEAEFEEATLDDIAIVGDSLRLVTKENRAYIDDFKEVSDWETVTTDMSSVQSNFVIDTLLSPDGVSSGKVTVESGQAEIVFLLKKTFAAQDWSNYNKISFEFYCDSAKHGDIYFYIYDAVSGSQQSYTMVLERNSPSINRDTLQIGWREIVIDISKYSRQNITSVGFYTSTTSGWNIADSLSFNVDEMYLTSGNIFLDRGTAVFKYGNDFQYTFSDIRWDASVPDDTYIRVRTRVSDSEDMSGALWSDYLTESGEAIILPSEGVYKYIEIEVTLESNEDKNLTPQLYALYLDCTVVSAERSFEFSTKDAWDAGELRNIDTESSPGKIQIKSLTDLGTYLYTASGVLKQLNSDMSERLSVYGQNVPKSFVQLKNGTEAGFGQISAVDVGLRDSFFIADTDNDRVLEVDKSGNVLWGLMGVFPETPINPYASSSGSSGSGGSSTSSTSSSTFAPLGCYYNVDESRLYVMFNADLENVYSSTKFVPANMFLKAGTRRIYLDPTKCKFSLFGVGEDYYGKDAGSGSYLSGSNVLQVDLSEADAVTISNVASTEDPYLVADSPKINEVVSQNKITAQFSVYNCELGNTEYGIKVQLDGGVYTDLRLLPSIDFDGLSDGLHILKANLIDSNGNILANEGCSCTIKFYISTGAFFESAVSILSLADNEMISSGDVSVEFATYNVPFGYSLRYIVDNGSYVQHDESTPIEIDGLTGGEHTLRLYLADVDNVVLPGDMTDITVSFVVGNRTSVSFSLVVSKDSIHDSKDNAVGDSIVSIYITPIKIANIYAPFDVHLITADTTEGDVSNFDILIAKVGTPSYLNYSDTSYRDGYSVVEYSEAGSLVLADNNSVIENNKENAKKFFGGAYKYGSDELFVADAYGKRAVVVELDTDKKTSSIVWAYDSDKIVSDFSRIPDASGFNYIRDSGIENELVYVRRDMSVTWYNNTNETIRILSGETDYDQFYADPDFDLFGSDFDSGDLLPGQYYTFRFINIGTYNYFVYPFIYTGKTYVLETSITPNDTFVLVENDPNCSSYLNRIIKIDAWGNVMWSFGESFASLIKDAKPISSNEIIIAV